MAATIWSRGSLLEQDIQDARCRTGGLNPFVRIGNSWVCATRSRICGPVLEEQSFLSQSLDKANVSGFGDQSLEPVPRSKSKR